MVASRYGADVQHEHRTVADKGVSHDDHASVEVLTPLWPHWVLIAFDQEREANEALEQALASVRSASVASA